MPRAERHLDGEVAMIALLDYGAGNVRSVRNAIRKLGYEIVDVKEPADIVAADKLISPVSATSGW